jgi:hypothetical protein
MKVILAGLIGQSGTGGQAWAYAQYMLSLLELGHDVCYLEDCGEQSWVYNWERQEFTTDPAYPAAYIERCLHTLGLGDRWIFRAGDATAGMSLAEFREFCSSADLLIIRAAPLSVWREEYHWPQRKAFIDVDPGFTQFSLIRGNSLLVDTLDRCDRVFTIAQRIGATDCLIPSAGYSWIPTLPPVSLSEWPALFDAEAEFFTSVMRWRGFRTETFEGVDYEQKNKTFIEFLELPRYSRQKFKLAYIGENPDLLTENGWHVTAGEIATDTPHSYRNFIQTSRAEFGVAKHAYVESRGGWFSDRSVCYLASGKPVLLQDTGLTDWLSNGEGLVLFRSLSDAIRGVELINSDYETHAGAARRLAEDMFDARKVVGQLLDSAMS